MNMMISYQELVRTFPSIAFWLYQRYSKILNTILIRLVLICNSVIFFRPVIQKNAKNGYHSIKNT
ncbi:hypothetical protein ECDEC6C_4370 [Escherichia coli DEC6C]|nr:hypothetical protein ECDEC6C_4370 [Escherichia coli DEC6C]